MGLVTVLMVTIDVCRLASLSFGCRYREKRKNRKFEKTIRYASRKAYAEVSRSDLCAAEAAMQKGLLDALSHAGQTMFGCMPQGTPGQCCASILIFVFWHLLRLVQTSMCRCARASRVALPRVRR